MASNGSIVENGIRFILQAKQRIVEIAPEKPKEMLHMNEEEVQPTKQQQEEESQQ